MGSLESPTISRSCSGGSVKICDDVWAEILCRFPEKALVQFKCVCKAWHRLISEVCLPRVLPASLPLAGLYFPTYALPHDLPLITRKSPHHEKAHFHRHLRADNDKLIHYTSLGAHNTNINSSSGGFVDPVAYFATLPFEQQSMSEFLDSCNGLLLFLSGYDCRYLVCNPMTRECVPIPKASIHKHRFYAALAFNPSESPSYKVVRFGFFEVEKIVLDIYSSITRQWVRHPVQLDSNVYRLSWIKHSVYLGGALYRLSKTWHLLRFDLNEVNASAIDLPKKIRRERIGCIGASMGHLLYAEANYAKLLVWSLDGIPEPMEWTLKYYLCMPLLRLNLGLFMGHASEHILWLEPCAFHPNKEFIFLATPLKIMSYGLKEHDFEVVYETRDGVIIHGCFRPSFTYLRLLVSLDHLGKIRCIPNQLETMSEGLTVLSLEEPFNDQEGIQVQMPKLSLMKNGNNVKG